MSKNELESTITFFSRIKKQKYVRNRIAKYGNLSKAFSDTELAIFFQNCTNKKSKLAFMCQAYLGLRVGEVVEMLLSDIDTKKHKLLVRTEKARTLDELYIHEQIRTELYEWIELKRERIEQSGGYIFFSEISGRKNISPNWLRNKFRYTITKSNLDEVYAKSVESYPNKKERVLHRLSTHSLRHYFITRVYRSTKNPIHTQKLARHLDFKSTQVYIHTNKEELNNSMKNTFGEQDKGDVNEFLTFYKQWKEMKKQ